MDILYRLRRNKMVFSSAIFLFAFLPIVFLIYFTIPSIKLKNALLIIASLIFYAFGEPVYVFLMIASTVFNYAFGRLLGENSKNKKNEKIYRKAILILAVVLNIGMLAVFKYTGFIVTSINDICQTAFKVPEIVLPIGISFFTFQALSYVIDVYRDEKLEQKSFFRLLLYISFFPQLIAGPIIRYHDIDSQIESRTINADKIVYGIQRFIPGLAKKMLLANGMGLIADNVFALNIGEYSFLVAWVGAICYTLQIYYDFSGYSDMAIGLASMFGFDFKENFDHPYCAMGLKDFWRRWHISLSTWFKEYVYIPLGGNRKGKFRTELNKMIVFLLTGIWHGANWTFVLWGIFHGVINVLEDTLIPIRKIKLKVVKNIYTWIVVITAFVIFRADTVTKGFDMLNAMYTNFSLDKVSISFIMEQFSFYNVFIMLVAVLFSYPLRSFIVQKLGKENKCIVIAGYVGSILLLVICILSLASAAYNPFIYFRF